VRGDDHAAKSSLSAHQSEHTLIAGFIQVVLGIVHRCRDMVQAEDAMVHGINHIVRQHGRRSWFVGGCDISEAGPVTLPSLLVEADGRLGRSGRSAGGTRGKGEK
jgi:hypothetical protein